MSVLDNEAISADEMAYPSISDIEDIVKSEEWEPPSEYEAPQKVASAGLAFFLGILFFGIVMGGGAITKTLKGDIIPAVEKGEKGDPVKIPFETARSVLAVVKRPDTELVLSLNEAVANGAKVTMVCAPPEDPNEPRAEFNANFPAMETEAIYIKEEGFLLNDFQWYELH